MIVGFGLYPRVSWGYLAVNNPEYYRQLVSMSFHPRARAFRLAAHKQYRDHDSDNMVENNEEASHLLLPDNNLIHELRVGVVDLLAPVNTHTFNVVVRWRHTVILA